VLIVDSNDAAREMYAWCLRAAGWVVREAKAGADGVVFAAAFQPGVIVFDLQLPDMTARELARRIRADQLTREIPLVGYSSADDAFAAQAARVAGCDEFFAKKCEPEALRALLDDLV
jgi:CheY-like chemotaxis protein